MRKWPFDITYIGALTFFSVICLFSCYSALRCASATLSSNSQSLSVRTRVSLQIPSCAEYQVKLADLRRSLGLSFIENLRDATSSSPANGALWIQLGLAEEQSGHLAKAEAHLLRASELGRDYDTRWTLANYYFRRSDHHRTILWACEALSIPSAPTGPIFSLLANISEQPDCLLGGEATWKRSVRSAYLGWLLSRGDLSLAAPVAAFIVRTPDKNASSVLLTFCDRLLLAGQTVAAANVWNEMSSNRIISSLPIRSDRLLDSSLMLAASGVGFAWRIPSAAGITTTPLEPGLQIVLSGEQADRCELLSQMVLVSPGAKHFLHLKFTYSGIWAGTTLHWQVTDPRSGALLSSTAIDVTGSKDQTSSASFETPSNGNLVRVALALRRDLAAPSGQGWVRLEKVWLSESP